MKKWRLVATATITLITDVEADSVEDAREIADKRGIQSVCHKCSGKNREHVWSLTGELDGEPDLLKGEEIELE